jgi:hypothetical protein
VARITWDHTYSETLPESVGKEFVSQAYSADSLRHRMEANVFLVAATGEEILGFANFHRLSETAVELAAIYVPSGDAGTGIGARLLSAGIGSFPPLTASCYESSRITRGPGASTKPTVSGTPESTRRSSTGTLFTSWR